jgi:hypothetical protein
MRNAKKELLSHYELENLNLSEEFDGAQVKHNTSWEEKEWTVFGPSQYQEFIKWLDFSYDNGYGSQELYGSVLLKCGAPDRWWFDRHEYDGSEYWVLRKRPILEPFEIKPKPGC